MLEVVRFNHEEGPVRIEIHKLKAQILALREMIKDKMLLDDKHINEILAETEDKYKYLVNKSRIRLGLFG